MEKRKLVVKFSLSRVVVASVDLQPVLWNSEPTLPKTSPCQAGTLWGMSLWCWVSHTVLANPAPPSWTHSIFLQYQLSLSMESHRILSEKSIKSSAGKEAEVCLILEVCFNGDSDWWAWREDVRNLLTCTPPELYQKLCKGLCTWCIHPPGRQWTQGSRMDLEKRERQLGSPPTVMQRFFLRRGNLHLDFIERFSQKLEYGVIHMLGKDCLRWVLGWTKLRLGATLSKKGSGKNRTRRREQKPAQNVGGKPRRSMQQKPKKGRVFCLDKICCLNGMFLKYFWIMRDGINVGCKTQHTKLKY